MDTTHAVDTQVNWAPTGIQPTAESLRDVMRHSITRRIEFVTRTIPTLAHSVTRHLSAIAHRVSSLARQYTSRAQPSKPLKAPPPVLQQVKAIILASYLNALLVFLPISWACHFALSATNEHDTLIFVFSFLAIIPLAKLLAFATDELSMRVGYTLAGIMDATLGNAVELIVAIIALVQCKLQVVQASLVGSILSNLLLVLGMCFFAGGIRFSEQGFGASITQLNSSLLIIFAIAVLLPAAFHFAAGSTITDDQESKDILAISHGVAIILLIMYCFYICFTLLTHKAQCDDNTAEVSQSTNYPKRQPGAIWKFLSSWSLSSWVKNTTPETEQAAVGPAEATQTQENGTVNEDPEAGFGSQEQEADESQLGVELTVTLLIVATVLVSVTAEFLVDSIDGLTDTGKVSQVFVCLVLPPIVGNAAEHLTAVKTSVEDKLTRSLGATVGSSLQIAFFVIPVIVTLAWIMGKPLSLLFDPFESIVLFLSVLAVNHAVQYHRSNWIAGMILMSLYAIVAVTFWYYPDVNELQESMQC